MTRLADFLLRPLRPAPRRFAAWQIEITTRCPLACRMCPRQGPAPWPARDMALEDFERLARHFARVDTVVLQGWGEPLLHPRLGEVVRRTKEGGAAPAGGAPRAAPAVGFVTSGKGLDDARAAELVAAGLDFLGLSVAGVSPATHAALRIRSRLDEVVGAGERLLAAKRGAGRTRPRVHVAFMMMRDNLAELPGLPALALRMGAEEVVLTNLVHVEDAWQAGQQVFGAGALEAERLVAEAEREARRAGIPLRRAALAPAAAAVCEEDPLRNLYVGVDGEVSPCVFLRPPTTAGIRRFAGGRVDRHPVVSLGNAFRDPLPEIADGHAAREFLAPFLRRAYRHRLAALLRWRAGPGALPDPPLPCRTCPKLLGV